MLTKRKKKTVSLDFGLLLLLSLSAISSILTFRKFNAYQKTIDELMKSNLTTLRNEHYKSLADLRKLVSSGFSRSNSSLSQTNIVSLDSSSVTVREVFRSLPAGLSVVQCGDWYLTDGIWKYGVGEMSPIGLITNIFRGVVMSDIGTFSFCNPQIQKSFVNVTKSEGGKFL